MFVALTVGDRDITLQAVASPLPDSHNWIRGTMRDTVETGPSMSSAKLMLMQQTSQK